MPAEILVTGGGGLLGHGLRKFIPEATFLTRRDGDLRDPAECERIFQERKPGRVLHLAACVGGVKYNADHNTELFTDNVQINLNVLNAAWKSGVKRLVSVLSSCAFQFYPDHPSTEEDLQAGLPYGGNLGYGFSKRLLDIHTRLLARQYGAQFSTVTPVTMYGPHDNWDVEDGHVVGALIHKCALARQEKSALPVWGTGQAVRQFVFSEDVARVLVEELNQFHGPETMIMAGDEGISIQKLAGTIAEVMDFRGPILYDSQKPEGERMRVLKSGIFGRRYPGFKFTPLKEGLGQTVEEFVS